MIEIELPWPPKELSPNARIHHFAKAKVTKVYREAAYWLAHQATRTGMTDVNLIEICETDRDVILQIRFSPPDRRRRDLDGMLSSLKAGLDGVADALQINDIRFGFNLRRAEPCKPGKVVIVIGEDHPISRANLGMGE